MPNKIENFKEYARKRIMEKLREDTKHSSKIEEYDETDFTYSGTDEEYNEFLDSLNDKPKEKPIPVGDTQTLNLHSVLGKVKETAEKVAGDVSSKAAEVKTKVSNAASSFTSPIEDILEDDKTCFERADKEETETIKTEPSVTVVPVVVPESSVKSDVSVDELKQQCSEALSRLDTVISNLSDINTRLQTIELKANDNSRQSASDANIIKDTLDKTVNMTLDIKNTINSVSKLNDSIFDLKNSQQNVKVAVSDMETGFKRLKGKCIAGFTIISIIGVITIALEVINLLS